MYQEIPNTRAINQYIEKNESFEQT